MRGEKKRKISANQVGVCFVQGGGDLLSTFNFWFMGRSPQSCTETDFEMKTSNLVLFLLISVVSVHFRAIDDETIPCQA